MTFVKAMPVVLAGFRGYLSTVSDVGLGESKDKTTAWLTVVALLDGKCSRSVALAVECFGIAHGC